MILSHVAAIMISQGNAIRINNTYHHSHKNFVVSFNRIHRRYDEYGTVCIHLDRREVILIWVVRLKWNCRENQKTPLYTYYQVENLNMFTMNPTIKAQLHEHWEHAIQFTRLKCSDQEHVNTYTTALRTHNIRIRVNWIPKQIVKNLEDKRTLAAIYDKQ